MALFFERNLNVVLDLAEIEFANNNTLFALHNFLSPSSFRLSGPEYKAPEPLRNSGTDDFSNDINTTGRLSLDGPAIQGTINSDDDRDWFAITVEAGQIVSFDVTGLEDSPFTRLNIIGQSGQGFLAFSSNYSSFDNTFVAHEFQDAGTYYLEVNDSQSVGISYEVTATELFDDFEDDTTTTGVIAVDGVTTGTADFEGDEDWFRLDVESDNEIFRFIAEGVEPDALYNVRISLYDSEGRYINVAPNSPTDFLGGQTAEFAYQIPEAGTYFVEFSASHIFGDYEIETALITDDFGDDDTTNGTLEIGAAAISGELQHFTDEDWFAFDIDQAGEILRFILNREDSPFPLALPNISIYNADGDLLTLRRRSDPNQTIYDFGFSEVGTYYIEISDDISRFLQSYNLRAVSQGTEDFLDNENTSGELVLDGGAVTGRIDFETDRDWFLLSVEQDNQHVQFDFSSGGRSIDISLLTNTGDLVRTFTYSSVQGPELNLDHVFADAGEYYVEFTFRDVQGAIGNYSLEATTPNDVTVLTPSDDNFTGTTSQDRIDGGAGDDVLDGGNGDAFDSDLLVGNDGNDTLIGGDGSDVLNGGEGNDNLYGGAREDNLFGGSGDDYLEGGDGADIINGGDGFDVAHYTGPNANTYEFTSNQFGAILNGAVRVIDGNGPIQFITQFGIDTLIDVEQINFGGTLLHILDPDAPVYTNDIDVLFGAEMNDIINAMGGDDVIYSQLGNDTVSGGVGNDILYGGDGDDIIFGDTGNDFLDGGDGDDSLNGGDGNDNFSAGAGNDIIWLGGGNDVVRTGFGRDVIFLSEGDSANQILDFDIRLDRVSLELLSDTSLSELQSYMTQDGNATVITLSDGTSLRLENVLVADLLLENFDLTIPAENDIFIGTDEDDVIDGGIGDDIISGLAGNDDLTGGEDHDMIYGGLGNDILDGSAGDDRLEGGPQNDTIFGGTGADVLVGGSGNDELDGWTGVDTALYTGLSAGVTVDLSVTTAQDTGGGGIDSLIRIENLVGSGHNDVLTGSSGRNRLEGGNGDDILTGGTNDDTLIGGAGVDTAVYFGAQLSDYTLTDIGNGTFIITDNVGTDGRDVLIGIEFLRINGVDFRLFSSGPDTVTGTAGDDSFDTLGGDDVVSGLAGNDDIFGGGGNDILRGGSGQDDLNGGSDDDRLEGGSGDDILFGGTGSDILVGGSGDDAIDGFTGIDTALYTGLSSGVMIDLNLTTQQDTGGGGVDSLIRVENLIGSGHDDTLTGTSARNRLEGGNGADTLAGMGGNDILIGGNGEDVLTGGAGADFLVGGNDDDDLFGGDQRDRLEGGAGADRLSGGDGVDRLLGGSENDVLMGGSGTDFLFGGAGNDTFLFNSLTDSGIGPYQRDEIRDWNTGDIIDVSDIDANTNLAGDQAFNVVNGGFTGAGGEIWVESLTRSGVDVQLIHFDVDGDGQDDMQLWVIASEIDASDFVL